MFIRCIIKRIIYKDLFQSLVLLDVPVYFLILERVNLIFQTEERGGYLISTR